MKKTWKIECLAGLALVGAAACQMPPYTQGWPYAGQERGPSSYWQSEGRYRQDGQAPSDGQPDASKRQASWDPVLERPSGPGGATGSPDGSAMVQEEPGTGEPPLLSWDGGVVDGAPQGELRSGTSGAHGLQPTTEGRMHILELYQDVLDERDALRMEVEALTAALERAQSNLKGTNESSVELEARLAAYEEGNRALREENREMAARLTTAQIRRLESEKLLLETRIAMHREESQAEEALATRRP